MENGQDIGRQLRFAQDYELSRFGTVCDEQSAAQERSPSFDYSICSSHMQIAEMPLYYRCLYDRYAVPIRSNLPKLENPEH